MSAPRPTPKRTGVQTFRERRAWQREERAYQRWKQGASLLVGVSGAEIILVEG